MNILVGQYHLNTIGGTETFTYTLCKELYKQGHNINLFTLNPGFVSNILESEIPNLKTNNIDYKKYDICLVNHNIVVDSLKKELPDARIIQTCHGTIPKLEEPSVNADCYVSISEEVNKYVNSLGFSNSSVILNGIDCDKFDVKNPINKKIKRILSLAQSNKANIILSEVANILNAELITINKNKNPIFEIQNIINSVDIVIGLGRSAYDAIACGRPVFIWDFRDYQGNLGDGFLTIDNFKEVVRNNCSGRRYNKRYTAKSIAKEILEKYNFNNSQYYRDLALKEFNIKKQVQKYLDL